MVERAVRAYHPGVTVRGTTSTFWLLLGVALVAAPAHAQTSASETVAPTQAPPPTTRAREGEEDDEGNGDEALPDAAAASTESTGDDASADAAAATDDAEAEATDDGDDTVRVGPFTFGGWVEAYYGWNFNQPSNGITDLRGFDNRHNSVNLSNIVLDAQWDWEGVNGRITLQWGSTPATYYLAETNAPSLGTGVGAQSQTMWQMVQQAFVGYRIPVGGGLNIQAGLFLSPIGVEAMAVRDNYLLSRSNLFYGFPFYHTGLRASYAITDELSVILWGINGWNTVLDNNDEKSFAVELSWATPGLLSANLTYLGGVERPRNAPEGRAWRHVIDLNATLTPIEWLGLQGQITGGWEDNAFGTSAYVGTLLSARFQIVEWLALAARGDFFWERVASNAVGSASAIFWPVEWVSSATAAVEIRPHSHIVLRLEYRHDHAAGDGANGACATMGRCAYFAGSVMGDGATTPFVHNASTQDTLTLGTTAWF